MTPSRIRSLTWFAAAALAGCGSSSSQQGGDGGTMPDAALMVDDAGHIIDAAPTPDSGRTPDAGPTPDGGLPSGYFWPWARQDVSGAGFLDPGSQTIINNWKANGGFGLTQIDTSIGVQTAAAGTPFMTFMPLINQVAPYDDSFYPVECDQFPMPLPVGGNVEGSTNYNCPRTGSGARQDCHLIVLVPAQNKLYEMYQADMTGGTFRGGCQVVWDMSKVYPVTDRGDTCTSVDAAGFPIQALLFTADEISAGHIDHAIRFILPNNAISDHLYRHPSTHVAGSNGTNGMPYGTRLRLKSDAATNATIATQARGAKIVAAALQKYGMFLADGGNLAFTAADDAFTTAKWDTAQTMTRTQLSFLTPDMFEVVKAPDGVDQTKQNNCVRTCWATADCPANPGGPTLTCQGAAGATPGTCR